MQSERLGFHPDNVPVWILARSADKRSGFTEGTFARLCERGEFPGELFAASGSYFLDDPGGLFATTPRTWWVRIADWKRFDDRARAREPEPVAEPLLNDDDRKVIASRRARLPAGHALKT